MYQNSEYTIEIVIPLENGIFVFDENSAIGKTRLCNELKELRKLGEPVIGYTYNDDQLGIDLPKLVNDVDPKVILLDRYDMYNGLFDEQMVEWAKTAVVLVDCKCELNINYAAEWCNINMEPARIEVIS